MATVFLTQKSTGRCTPLWFQYIDEADIWVKRAHHLAHPNWIIQIIWKPWITWPGSHTGLEWEYFADLGIVVDEKTNSISYDNLMATAVSKL